MNDPIPAAKYYPIALLLTRIYEIGISFGVGWIASKLAGLFGAGPVGQWWAFYVPVMMTIVFVASGFISEMLPIPVRLTRPFIYLVLLGVGFFVLADQSPEQESPEQGFHFTATLESQGTDVERLQGRPKESQSTVVEGLQGRDKCERARKVHEGEGLRAGPCVGDK
jgi:hypothetical protein